MIRRPPRSTLSSSSAASDVYKRQEYQFIGVVDVPPPKTRDEFHSARYQFGFAFVPRFVRVNFRSSPFDPTTFVPVGTLVMFIDVRVPVLGSYAAQQVIPPKLPKPGITVPPME